MNTATDFLANIESAIAKGKLNQDVTLYRGLHDDSESGYASDLAKKFVEAIGSGDPNHPARLHAPCSFQETSLDQAEAHGLAGDNELVLEINAKAGLPALAPAALTDDSHDRGIILPRNVQYKLNKLYKSGGKLYAGVDVGVSNKGLPSIGESSRELTIEELSNLIGASARLGLTPGQLDCALGEIGLNGESTPANWRLLRHRLEEEVRRFKNSQK